MPNTSTWNISTWSETRASLPANLPHEAMELIRRHTAPARHSARVREAAMAALREANRILAVTHNPLTEEQIELITRYDKFDIDSGCQYHIAHAHCAMLLCLIEARGIGGPMGLGDRFGDGNNRSTQRAEWARGLGKGRAHACDGQAWTAAISGANCAFYCAIESAIERDKAMHAARLTGTTAVLAMPDDALVLDLIDSPQSRAEAARRMIKSFDLGKMDDVAKWADLMVIDESPSLPPQGGTSNAAELFEEGRKILEARRG